MINFQPLIKLILIYLKFSINLFKIVEFKTVYFQLVLF